MSTQRTDRHPRRQRRPMALCAIVATLLAGTVPLAVAEAATATATTLDAPSGMVFGPVTVTGHVRPAPQPSGGFIPAVSFTVDGSVADAEPLDANGDATGQLTLLPGSYQIKAVFGELGDFSASESAPATVDVGVATATTLTSSMNPALTTQAVTLTATVSNTQAVAFDGGTLTIKDTTSGTVVLAGPLTVGPGATQLAVTTPLGVGSHAIVAEYSGHGSLGPSSANLSQSIVLDQAVNAGSFRVYPPTFYPVRDGYRDFVRISGVRNEPARVTIRIYSVATGRRVLLGAVAMGSGAYHWDWYGRGSTGTVLAAGQYRVVQTLVDAGANVLNVTRYLTLSHKKLYWTTATRTLRGNQFALKGDPGDGSVSTALSSYVGGVRLSSGHVWVAVSYAFTVPTATAYRNVTFKVLGRSLNGRRAVMAIWNPDLGSYLNVNAYDRAKLTNVAYGWSWTSGSIAQHRAGARTRALVLAQYSSGAVRFDVRGVAATFQYAVLR